MLRRRALLMGASVTAAALTAAPLRLLWVASPAHAQSGPMPPQVPLDQLTGDAFDQRFLYEMTMHHAMAVVMAQPVAMRAIHTELAALASAIVTDQTREIGLMRGWLKDWFAIEMRDPVVMMAMMSRPMAGMSPSATDHEMHSMPDSMDHMMQMSMMQMSMMAMDLSTLPPNRMEVVFMSQMIVHHQEALDMADLIHSHSRTQRPEMHTLARAITTAQTAEIAQMNGWLADWYGL